MLGTGRFKTTYPIWLSPTQPYVSLALALLDPVIRVEQGMNLKKVPDFHYISTLVENLDD